MLSRFLIATDSFKGSLSSLEAAKAIEEGVKEIFPKADIRMQALADGGEGTLDMLCQTFPLQVEEIPLEDLYGEKRLSKIYYDKEIAFLEAANMAGLREKKDVFLASSKGFGEELLLAANRKPKTILLGIGGTGVNDGGMGLLHALGIKFFHGSKRLSPSLENLLLVDGVQGEPTSLPSLLVACDVENPLLGEKGASRVYGPQKGLEEKDLPRVEEAMERYALLLEKHFGKEVKELPGAGAAGGLGFALLLLGAKLRPGFELLSELCHLEKSIDWAEVIITGEGKFDEQSLYGKGPMELAKKAKEKGKILLGLFGSVETDSTLFDGLFSTMQSPMSLEEAMEKQRAKDNLRRTARNCAKLLALKK